MLANSLDRGGLKHIAIALCVDHSSRISMENVGLTDEEKKVNPTKTEYRKSEGPKS